MKLKDIIQKLDLTVRCSGSKLDDEVSGGYVSDLLSDVIANCQNGNVWITKQGHLNIVAVAVLKDIAAIIVAQGREPNKDTIKKAEEENITILVSRLQAFQLVGELYELGIGKTQ